MSKLIYAPTASLAENTYQNIRASNQTVNAVYFSVCITGDGYLYTHGKKFRIFDLDNSNVLNDISFSINNGTAQLAIDGQSRGSANVIQSITEDGIVKVTSQDGVAALSHKEYLGINSPTQYGSVSKIPIITVDKYGHVSSISESATIDTSQVQANPVENVGNYYLLGVTGNTIQNPIYSDKVYIDKNGNLNANNLIYNGTDLDERFAPLEHVSTGASDTVLGHVKLWDQPDNTKDITELYAATPKAVYQALSSAKTYADNLVNAQNSMIFVGTITSLGVIKSHNPNVLTATNNQTNFKDTPYKIGWTFRFTEAGSFEGENVEPGDMIIAVDNKEDSFSFSDWTIIQNNIDGALTSNFNLSGLLYANNSRSVQSLLFGNGILKSDGTSIEFVNPNTIWRDIQVSSNSIGTSTFNLIPGTNVTLSANGGDITIGVNASGVISAGASLNLIQDSSRFQYNPSATADLQIGDKLSLIYEDESWILKHATINISVSNKLGKITTDGYGHISSFEEVTGLKNPYAFNIKNVSSTIMTYDGSEAKNLKILNGTDISLSLSEDENNNILLTPSITHKYRSIQFLSDSTQELPTSLIQSDSDTVLTLVGGDNVILTNVDANDDPLPAGTLVIHAEDTWRNVEAYRFQSNILTRSSIGSAILKFGSDFLYTEEEIGLCWTEIDSEGRVTYVK